MSAPEAPKGGSLAALGLVVLALVVVGISRGCGAPEPPVTPVPSVSRSR